MSFVLLFIKMCFYLLLVTCIPRSLAGPACARRNRQSVDCTTKCAGRWGWPGHAFGSDPWGVVLSQVALDNTLMPHSACQSAPEPSPITPSNTSTPVANAASDPSSSDEVANTSPAISSTPPPAVSLSGWSNVTNTTASSHKIRPTSTSKLATSSNFSHSPSSSSHISKATTSHASQPPKVTSTSSADSHSSSQTATSEQSSDITAFLDAHNSIRAQHGARPLTWSVNLATKAQQWSNQCVFKHSGGSLGPFGENLAAGTGGGYGISEGVKGWTDEISQYDSNNPQPSHFTQVVWKSSTQIGCASSECSGIFASSFGPAKYIVCEYYPQGNIIGSFPENVQT